MHDLHQVRAICREYVETVAGSRPGDWRVAAMTAYVLERLFDSDLDFARAYEDCRVSRRDLPTRFYLAHGLRPQEFVLHHRLMAARRSLKETMAPVTLIALLCGFGSSQALSMAMKRNFGVSPSLYRRQATRLESRSDQGA